MKHPFRLRIGDLFVLAGILLLAGGIFLCYLLPSSAKKNCIIMQDNVIIKELELTSHTEEIVTVAGTYENIIEIQDGKVRISQANCPDQTCVSSGWISKPGQALICLPNKLLVKIVSQAEGEVDVIVS